MPELPVTFGHHPSVNAGASEDESMPSPLGGGGESPANDEAVPRHRELDRATLRSILRQAGLSAEEFLDLLER
jgi:hypothetical protein